MVVVGTAALPSVGEFKVDAVVEIAVAMGVAVTVGVEVEVEGGVTKERCFWVSWPSRSMTMTVVDDVDNNRPMNGRTDEGTEDIIRRKVHH